MQRNRKGRNEIKKGECQAPSSSRCFFRDAREIEWISANGPIRIFQKNGGTENAELNARDQLTQADAVAVTDLVAVYKALGGGWACPSSARSACEP
jgi:hypothetical protein